MANIVRQGVRFARILPRVAMESREEAAQILKNAHTEAERIRQAAHVQGYNDGQAAAASQLLRVKDLATQQPLENKAQLAKLAMQVARKIIGQTLEVNPTWLEHTLDEALQKVQSANSVQICVHPKNEQQVQAWIEQRKEKSNEGHAVRLELELKSELGPEDVILVTNVGIVDSRFEIRLGALQKVLLQSL